MRNRWNAVIRRTVVLLPVLLLLAGGAAPAAGTHVVCVADIHFTPFADPALFDELAAAPADQWGEILDRSRAAGMPSRGEETNALLLDRTLEAVARQTGECPVALFQGDILAHGFRERFFKLYGKEDTAAYRSFVEKTVAFIADSLRDALPPDTPMLFVLGNNDAYAGDYRLVPGGPFLADTARLFHETFLLGQPAFDSFAGTYRRGGYYRAPLPRSGMTALCLNTVLFSRNRSGGEEAARRQLDWLETNLATARAEGSQVWLLMHVPPGVDPYATVKSHMESAGEVDDAVMMWKAPYRRRFTALLEEYGETVSLGFAGHMHMDTFRLVAGEVVLVIPAVSPVFGNNPAFQTLALDDESWEILDRRSYSYPLSGDTGGFAPLYDTSQAYGLHGPLAAGLAVLPPRLATDRIPGMRYIHFYDSGCDTGKAITDTTWPVYRCAIGHTGKAGFLECVRKAER